MNSRETPHVPAIQQCLPIGMVGHAERKAAEMAQAEVDRGIGFDKATLANDGPTGERKDILCWECQKPLVSYCHVLMGKRLWTTIHEHCAEAASRRLWPRVRREKKPEQKQYRAPYGN